MIYAIKATTELVNRLFQFHQRSQDFIGTHDETLSVAMRVHDPDRIAASPGTSTADGRACSIWQLLRTDRNELDRIAAARSGLRSDRAGLQPALHPHISSCLARTGFASLAASSLLP
jgi:hypothetical protein